MVYGIPCIIALIYAVHSQISYAHTICCNSIVAAWRRYFTACVRFTRRINFDLPALSRWTKFLPMHSQRREKGSNVIFAALYSTITRWIIYWLDLPFHDYLIKSAWLRFYLATILLRNLKIFSISLPEKTFMRYKLEKFNTSNRVIA